MKYTFRDFGFDLEYIIFLSRLWQWIKNKVGVIVSDIFIKVIFFIIVGQIFGVDFARVVFIKDRGVVIEVGVVVYGYDCVIDDVFKLDFMDLIIGENFVIFIFIFVVRGKCFKVKIFGFFDIACIFFSKVVPIFIQ